MFSRYINYYSTARELRFTDELRCHSLHSLCCTNTTTGFLLVFHWWFPVKWRHPLEIIINLLSFLPLSNNKSLLPRSHMFSHTSVSQTEFLVISSSQEEFLTRQWILNLGQTWELKQFTSIFQCIMRLGTHGTSPPRTEHPQYLLSLPSDVWGKVVHSQEAINKSAMWAKINSGNERLRPLCLFPNMKSRSPSCFLKDCGSIWCFLGVEMTNWHCITLTMLIDN